MILRLRWKRRPRNHWLRWLLASAGGACVLIAALQAPAFRKFTGLSRHNAAQNTALTVPEVLPADLIVSEAVFAGPAERRKIGGVLKNRSGRTYTDIQMTFCLVGPNGDTVGWAAATVNRIGGHETANFEAPDVTPKAVEIVLTHIETQPRLAGAP